MSFPSISEVLSERDIDLQSAGDETLSDALWEALHRNLPEGTRFIENFVTDFAALSERGEKRLLRPGNPNTEVAKQVNRILGTDIARRVCEQKLGVVFGLYNCHAPVVAYHREDLALSFREQIELQNGVLASADC